ncbi:MAG TPA: GNAT family N-acetyltransferase [Acidimicrobiales bacterium]
MAPPRTGPEAVALAPGRMLRAAVDDDIEAIVALETEAFGASDGPGVRGHLTAAGAIGDWTVVVDGTEVVAASGLLAHRMRLDGCPFSGGQIEYVVTHPDVRRQGLVRAQFAWHHRRAAARGDLALFITGIPYLYRRLGYGYGLDYPPFLLPSPAASADIAEPASVGSPAGGLRFRPATGGDLEAIRALDSSRPATGLRVERDGLAWSTIVAICAPDTFEHLTVVERDGRVVGWMRTQDKPEDDRVYLAAAAVDADEAPTTARHMVEWVRNRAGAHVLVVFDQAGSTFSRHLVDAPGLGGSARHDHGIYVRVPDPVALLDALRPVLSARFAASRYADRDGEVVISLYDRGVALDLVGGRVAAVRSVPGIEDPFAGGEVGVAPDWFGALAFGRWGAIGLEQRADDVTLGRRRGLMDVLFPAVDADVVGDF